MVYKKESLENKIEKKRISLYKLKKKKGSLKDKEVINLSKNLDKLLNCFYQHLSEM